jgi:competence protein ComEC
VFAVGPRLGISDAGQRVVSPVLRALGVRHINALIISHPDIDHAGGLPGLLREMSVSLSYASFNLEHFLDHTQRVLKIPLPIVRPAEVLTCQAGVSWIWDGVTFTILHPAINATHETTPSVKPMSKKKVKTNAQSCVLHIQGKHHSALLPGDIGNQQEKELSGRVRADVALVAHHGSTTSSHESFISHLGARHAIAQVGYLNRFSHPAPEVEQRWKALQTEFWRTDRDGDVTAESSETGLVVYSQALQRKRYWHDRN